MIFKKIKLKNYRNLSESEITFSPRLNIFLGQNGQGKTNLLEALYLLCRGESFRYGDNSDFIQSQKEISLIRCEVEDQNLAFDLKILLEQNKKTHLINEKKVSAQKISEKFIIVLFSPESLASIKEGPELRRSLIDDFIVNLNPNNHKLITDYRKALRSRNKILKNHLEGLTNRTTTENLLLSINPIFFKLGTLLAYERIQAIEAILPDMNAAMKYISATDVDISVEYVVSGQNFLGKTKENIYQALQKRAQELSSAEFSSGSSLVGPHKHDVTFLYNQKDSRIYCSQGQQRAMILSFKMAQIVYHRRAHNVYPVLLLDDVLSELDGEKRDRLITFLSEIKTQIFITTTDFNLPQALENQDLTLVHDVKEGNCVRRTNAKTN